MDPASEKNHRDKEHARDEETGRQPQRKRSRPKLRIRVPGDQNHVYSPEDPVSYSNPTTTKEHALAPTPSLTQPTTANFTETGRSQDDEPWLYKLRHRFSLPDIDWIRKNLDASHWKPAIRAAVAAWISVVFLVVWRTQELLGQASFIILIAAFLSPPAEPFMQVLEREVAILFFASSSFAWTCLGIRIATLARKEVDPSASVTDIFAGRYIEPWPTVICAIFLFIGASVLLYIRARVGPGPYAIAIILSCIVLDISLTVGHLFPYPYYDTGKYVVIPIAFHSAIALVCSAFVFPETVNAQFIKRFRSVFLPLCKAMRTQQKIFEVSPLSEDFDPTPFFTQVTAAEGALAPLAATSRLMKRDLSWGRFGSKDFSRLHELVRRMTVRANGMAFYFKIMDSSANRQPGTPAFSLLNTPAPTPPASRPPSPTRSAQSLSLSRTNTSSNVSVASAPASIRRRHQHRHSAHNSLYQSALNFYHTHHRNSRQHSRFNPSSLFHDVFDRSEEGPVGVFESQRYLNLETRLMHPNAEEVIPQVVGHLSESSSGLTECCADALDHLARVFDRMNQDRFWKLFCRERERTWEETICYDEEMRAKLRSVLDEFKQKKRHHVLDLYRPHVDSHLSPHPHEEPPPHRYLFQCYMYQYHLMFFAEHLCQLLDELIDLEKTRPRSRLWLPILPLKQILIWSKWEPTEVGMQHNEDEDPDVIQGIDPERSALLGQPERRDPDALPPGNKLEAIGSLLYHLVSALGRGNAVFGLKAGLLSVLLSLPNFLPSSASFAYQNRSIWAVVIGQLTLSRFRGDTIFGWFSRVMATFLGGITGAVMWYISTGQGNGNAYGLAAISAVVFPFLFFIKLYYPAAPMTLTIFIVTTGLVVGYSWQDVRMPNLSNAGKGIQVAWKRFVLVAIGVSVAFFFSYLPPSTTLRRYLRTTYATAVQQLGEAYCDVVSYATVREGPETEAIVKELIASRLKLRRSKALMANVVYEFSLRGKWPRERYEAICEIELEIAYLLSHLRSVTDHLELQWARAFLKRTRFLEPEFQGDVLAVISMISTSLRTGTPLPQVTPCPLLDRFVAPLNGAGTEQKNGKNINEDGPDDWDGFAGLPKRLTAETLEDEQYLYFSVGVATAFGIVTRLDRLMVATKELVGEQFHIHGLPVYTPKGGIHPN